MLYKSRSAVGPCVFGWVNTRWSFCRLLQMTLWLQHWPYSMAKWSTWPKLSHCKRNVCLLSLFVRKIKQGKCGFYINVSDWCRCFPLWFSSNCFAGKSSGTPLPPATSAMEGLYFEVKPRKDEPPRLGSSEKPPLNKTSNPYSCSSLSRHSSSTLCSEKLTSARKRISAWWEKAEEEEEEEEVIQYKLTLIGYLPVHHLTTMAMLPWVVAEISKSQPAEKEMGAGWRLGGPACGQLDPCTWNQTVCLCVSASWVRCVCVLAEGDVRDPLTHTMLFECRPHQVTKLIHNSQEPSSFGCLVRNAPSCACYVFQCQDSTKVGVCVWIRWY